MKSKIAIPETTSIGGHDITVELVEDEALPEDYGEYVDILKKIRINRVGQRSDREETYIHEIIEAVDTIFHLELPHSAIQTLGAGIYQALVSGKGRAK